MTPHAKQLVSKSVSNFVANQLQKDGIGADFSRAFDLILIVVRTSKFDSYDFSIKQKINSIITKLTELYLFPLPITEKSLRRDQIDPFQLAMDYRIPHR